MRNVPSASVRCSPRRPINCDPHLEYLVEYENKRKETFKETLQIMDLFPPTNTEQMKLFTLYKQQEYQQNKNEVGDALWDFKSGMNDPARIVAQMER
jgi:hypothetical protein